MKWVLIILVITAAYQFFGEHTWLYKQLMKRQDKDTK